MLGQRRRRWASIRPELGQRLVFAGSVVKPHHVSHQNRIINFAYEAYIVSTVHRSYLITIITKAIDTTLTSFFCLQETVTLLVYIERRLLSPTVHRQMTVTAQLKSEQLLCFLALHSRLVAYCLCFHYHKNLEHLVLLNDFFFILCHMSQIFVVTLHFSIVFVTGRYGSP